MPAPANGSVSALLSISASLLSVQIPLADWLLEYSKYTVFNLYVFFFPAVKYALRSIKTWQKYHDRNTAAIGVTKLDGCESVQGENYPARRLTPAQHGSRRACRAERRPVIKT